MVDKRFFHEEPAAAAGNPPPAYIVNSRGKPAKGQAPLLHIDSIRSQASPHVNKVYKLENAPEGAFSN